MREDLAGRFHDRLLPVDDKIAVEWGRISGTSDARGAPLPVTDALIAATSVVHGLVVATRNTADLARCGARCVNPREISLK